MSTDSTIQAPTIPGTVAGTMRLRRVGFFLLVALTHIGMMALFLACVGMDGLDAADLALALLFLMFLPWSIIGFWNATIGFLVMRLARDPVAAVTPQAGRIIGTEPITGSIAILICIRNEEVDRVFLGLGAMLDGLRETGEVGAFHLYVLSDTTDDRIAGAEQAAFDRLQVRHANCTYRRRLSNPGFKAGNIRDFCDRWGEQHDFMLTLDADSVMSAGAILRLARIMQAHPRLGILQSLVVGLPSVSPFARIFQFGMRLGMRSYTIGSAWWQGDCGPYWGHNALIRVAPFKAHCHLPILPGKGPLAGDILSHDQVEAVLMRRAGFEVRVLPIEDGSYEANPPTLTEFIRRDLRWCQGNMQYLKLLGMKGVSAISQYQLCFAILMFLGSPAAVLFGIIALVRLHLSTAAFDGGLAQLIFVAFIIMNFAPKMTTLADVLMRPALRSAYGGWIRILISAALELVFTILILPIMTLSQTLSLAGFALGRAGGWGAQLRGDQALTPMDAAAKLWPHTLAGLAAAILFGSLGSAAFWWTLPMTLGPMLSIPIAVVTSRPDIGCVMVRLGLSRLPEETEPPADLVALDIPALTMRMDA